MAKTKEVLLLDKAKLYGDQRDRAALEPQPQRNLKPRCPRTFNQEQRVAWREYSTLLQEYGLFQAGNAGVLRRLSTAAVVYHRLEKLYFDTDDLRVSERMLKVAKRMDDMEVLLGLPSTARARLGSLMLKAKKEKEEFFND